MNKLHAWMAGAAFAMLVTPAIAQKKTPDKKVYCWDDNGRKICGDALPADAVDKARTEISASSGLATKTMERAPTMDERATAKARAEQERLAALKADAAVRREMAMVESYASEAELRRAFQQRIVLLDEAVKSSTMGISGLRQSLLALLRRAGEAELASKPVAKPLAGSIQTQHDALLQQQTTLIDQMRERRTMDRELNAALERYRSVKSETANQNG